MRCQNGMVIKVNELQNAHEDCIEAPKDLDAIENCVQEYTYDGS